MRIAGAPALLHEILVGRDFRRDAPDVSAAATWRM